MSRFNNSLNFWRRTAHAGIGCRLLPVFFSLFVFTAGAREVVIDILHTADVHGNVFGSGIDRESSANGGLLRCVTMVGEIRASNSNVVLIDCGDLFQGSVESFLTRGRVVADTVKAMGYDGLVVGNHEFDWGYDFLGEFYARAGIKVLAADVFGGLAEVGQPVGFTPFILREFDGVRLVVIGLSNPHMPRWFKPARLGGLKFENSTVALRKIMPAVRAARPDIIVLAVHQGYRDWGDNPANNINAIATGFPELDAIIGAHSHEAAPELDLNGVLYTQADPYARSLGRLRLKFDLTRRQLTEKSGELLPASTEIRQNKKLADEFQPIMEETKEWLNQVIGSAACDHDPQSATPGQSRAQSLIAAAIAEATGAEIVLHGALSSGSIHAGNIRMRDVWRIVPYENTIGIAALTLDDIRAILVENSRYLNSTQFRGVYGVSYNLDVAETNHSVTLTRISGIPVDGLKSGHAGRRYKTAFNSFDLASAGDRLPVLRRITEQPACKLTDAGMDTRQMVVEYIKKYPNLDVLFVPPDAGVVISKQ